MTTPASPTKIILDTDPGGDDIFALLWGLSLVQQGLAELVAITTADGNVAAPQTFASASQLLGLTGFAGIEVGRGVPLKQATAEDASHIHGTDGMGELSTTLPPSSREFMIGTALRYRETNRVPGFLVHDAVTLGYLFYPETLTLRRARVRVETQGKWTRGQTLIDDRPLAKTDANAWVALQVDEVGFFTHFIEDLKYLMKQIH